MTMKKKVLASLVATMAVGATCAFAANPFADVPTDSWAYNAVVQLADAGIINGVNGADFQGNREITRYEAAQMTAKAMAHMDKATMEQRALINKLADEYADELNNLGVRVTNLENKVGNVKLTGDFRLRYKHQSDAFSRDNGTNNTSDQFQYRARLRARAYVNDNTSVLFGVSSNNKDFNTENQADTDSNSLFVDDANVTTNFGKNFSALAGREDLYVLGDAAGLQYGDVFDTAQLTYKGDHFKLFGGFGQFKEGANYSGYDGHGVYNTTAVATKHSLVGVKTGYGELEGQFGKLGAGVYYNGFSGDKAEAQNLSSLFGGYLKFDLGTNFHLLGDYQKIRKDHEISGVDENANLWTAKLTYGAASFAKKGSWDGWVEYINADPNALYGSTNSWRNASLLDNVKSWGAGVDYTVGKNVMFSVMQSFGTDLKKSSYSPNDQKPGEETRAQFVFVF